VGLVGAQTKRTHKATFLYENTHQKASTLHGANFLGFYYGSMLCSCFPGFTLNNVTHMPDNNIISMSGTHGAHYICLFGTKMLYDHSLFSDSFLKRMFASSTMIQ
jgi:hypothetical protein